MPGGRDEDDSGDAPPRLSLRHRLLLLLPHLSKDPDKAPLGERLRGAVLKPVDPGTGAAKAKAPDKRASVEELEAHLKYADDKERLIGLLLAPIAAAIGILVVNDRISKHAAQFLSNGKPNPQYVSLSLLHELELVFLGLAAVMVVTAYFRKRLFLGIAMALYGLAIFNLRYWGFGVPFIMVGAWLLVRAYRAQRDLREAVGNGPSRSGGGRRGGANSNTSRRRPNKRYTPRSTPPKRQPPKPENEQKAG